MVPYNLFVEGQIYRRLQFSLQYSKVQEFDVCRSPRAQVQLSELYPPQRSIKLVGSQVKGY